MTLFLTKLFLFYILCSDAELKLMRTEVKQKWHSFCEHHLIADDPYDDGRDE